MRGFDPKWQDVTHYIVGITKEILEDRKIGSLRELYADGIIVRSSASVVTDNSIVIAATMATFAEFPDRELLGEDVIWCDDPKGATKTSDAFLSSHRLICTATHNRPGKYGAPTGKCIFYRILADKTGLAGVTPIISGWAYALHSRMHFLKSTTLLVVKTR